MEFYGIKCKKVICFLGWPRSGQHAISTWILNGIPGRNLMLNNIQDGNYDVLDYMDGVRQPKYDTSNKSVDLLCLGYEGGINRKYTKIAPKVYILRDLYNNMSSLYKAFGKLIKNFFEIWTDTAKKIDNTRDDELIISFPLWHISEEYRKECWLDIMNLAGLDYPFNDSGREVVSDAGGGSSFDRQKLNGKASTMKVLNRWKSFPCDHSIIPSETKALNDKYFGWIYDS